MYIFAACVLKGEGIDGLIKFAQDSKGGQIVIKGIVTGLTPGYHGFHIHEFGDLSNGCTSAGAHYNPFNKQHGGPTDTNRHVGDLGNIFADQSGEATFSLTDNLISLLAPYSIIGRSMVVHAMIDDLGRGGDAESKLTGNAGARVACGVIGKSASF